MYYRCMKYISYNPPKYHILTCGAFPSINSQTSCSPQAIRALADLFLQNDLKLYLEANLTLSYNNIGKSHIKHHRLSENCKMAWNFHDPAKSLKVYQNEKHVPINILRKKGKILYFIKKIMKIEHFCIQ